MFSALECFLFYKFSNDNFFSIITLHFFPFSLSFLGVGWRDEFLGDLRIFPLQTIPAENKFFHIFFFYYFFILIYDAKSVLFYWILPSIYITISLSGFK